MDSSGDDGVPEKVRSVEKKAKKSKKHKKHKKSSKSTSATNIGAIRNPYLDQRDPVGPPIYTDSLSHSHSPSPDKPEKSKKSKSSKKSKRRHSDETHSEAEEGGGHRSHKAKKLKESVSEAVPVVKVSKAEVVVPHETLANVLSPKKRPAEAVEVRKVSVQAVVVPVLPKDRKTSHSSNHSHDHIVTNKSNGQSKSLTNPKSSSSSKLGGIPTDPSKLVEILTKSVDPHATTEVLSSDSEEDR